MIKNNEIKNGLDEIKEWEEKIKWKDLIYRTNKYKYDFQQYETIKYFGESISAGKISIEEAEWIKRTTEDKNKKRNTLEKVNALYEGRELTINAFKSGILLIKSTQGNGLKMLIPKQILQRLPIDLAQVKVGNTFENLLNEIRQIIYSFYRAKEATKKVYN